jgi:lysylphosphatidylglycerol synthetase-like protein (DUF2156 family)
VRTIKYSWLAVIALCAGVLGWLANLLVLRSGLPVPVLHLSSLATMAAVVVFTLALGLKVRSWRNGKREKPLDPILAARTLVLAQACAYAGSLLLGWHAGILVDQLMLLAFRPASEVLLQVLAMMGGGLVMVVVGLVVERFCKLPPEDPEAVERERRSAEGEGEYA